MDGEKTINGTFGTLWMDGEKLGNCKSFEAKLKTEYEDIQFSNELGTDSKYMGYSIEGTITLLKMDSVLIKKIHEGFNTGKIPEIVIVSGLDDPSVGSPEKVQINGVKFTELTLQKWETKTIVEEEAPFRAKSYKYLELI